MEEKFHVGAKALILNNKNQILILKSNPKKLRKGVPIHWDLPGGRLKKNQTILEALKEELNEETNISINNLKILKIFDVSISKMKIPVEKEEFSLLLITYLCKLTKNNLNFKIKSDEHIDYDWVDKKKAKKLLKLKFSNQFIKNLDNL